MLVASEDEYRLQSTSSDSKLMWNVFENWVETKNLFALIIRGATTGHMVPKRAFGPGEVDAFCDLLQRKIPKK